MKNNNKKRILSLLAVATMLTSASGCNNKKNVEKGTDEITITASIPGIYPDVKYVNEHFEPFREDTIEKFLKQKNKNNEKVKYTHVLDFSKLDFFDSNENYEYDPEFLYINKSAELTTSLTDAIKSKNVEGMSTLTSKLNSTYILPSCYEWAKNFFAGSKDGTKVNIKYYEFVATDGNIFRYKETEILFTDDFNFEYILDDKKIASLKAEGKVLRNIAAGNSLKYRQLSCILDNEEIILASSQEGMGSDCENVKNGVMNNFDDDLLVKIGDLKLFDSSVELTNNELNDLINSLKIQKVNDEKKVLTKEYQGGK